jgi:alpha-tubulin suppressor-like RCC1 family protein
MCDFSCYLCQSWGRGNEGQLGTGKNINVQKIPSIINMTKKIAFYKIHGGEEYSGGITKLDGHLYTWGTGNMGQLGTISMTSANSQNKKKNDNIDSTKTPSSASLSASTSCWTPRRVSGIRDYVLEISFGMTHSAALTRNGALYTWGSGFYGKLGHGNLNNYWVPKIVNFFQAKKITQISISTYHSMAVDEEGNLYAWGRGDQRLGLGPIDQDVMIPKRNDDLWSQNIVPVVITAAENHNVIISKKNGEVYSFGDGKYGKLGISTRNDMKLNLVEVSSTNPANVRDIDGEPLELGELPDFAIQQGKVDIRSVSSYSNHSLALSRDGILYSWGNGGSGRLATGTTKNQSTARMIESIQSQFNTARVDNSNTEIQQNGDAGTGGGGEDEDIDNNEDDDDSASIDRGDGSLRDLLQRV